MYDPEIESKKLFDRLDKTIIEAVLHIPSSDNAHRKLYALIMSTLSSLVHIQLDSLAATFIKDGLKTDKRKIFFDLLKQINSACKKGYNQFSQYNEGELQ